MQRYIKFNEIGTIIKRKDLLDQVMRDQIKKRVEEGQSIFFMPNTVLETVERIAGTSVDTYRIYIYGVLPCGSKTVVILNNVPVYFDIRVEECENIEELSVNLNSLFARKSIKYKRFEFTQGYRQDEFRMKPDQWIRFYFDNLRDRSNCLKFVQQMDRPGYLGERDGYKEKRRTASDDNGGFIHNYYYPKVAREYQFNTCAWNWFEKYHTRSTAMFPNVDYAFDVDVADYLPADSKLPTGVGTAWVTRDPLIAGTYDIETYTFKDVTGDAPKPEDTNWNIFMICTTIHFVHSREPIARFVICDTPIENSAWVFKDPDDKFGHNSHDTIIQCSNERELLQAYIAVLKNISPDIWNAFNNGSFDEPLIREMLKRYNLLLEFRDAVGCVSRAAWEQSKEFDKFVDDLGETSYIPNNDAIAANADRVYKFCWTNENIKISAEENLAVLRLDVPGILNTDTMPVFKQMYPRSEIGRKYGLNYFLSLNKLPQKYDLPYKIMFKYYHAAITYARDILEKFQKEAEDEIIGICIDCGVTDPTQISNAIALKRDILANKKFIEYSKSPAFIENRKTIDHNMAEVAKYCLIDAYSCQRLFVQRVIVSDKREVSNGSFVTLFAGFYRANGMKVRNLVGSECFRNKNLGHIIQFSNAHPSNKKMKYPGAWVVPPRKGLNNRRPVVGLDFASLYPSLMMVYGLSPEKSIEYKGPNPRPDALQFVEELLAMGYVLHKTEFEAVVTDENAEDFGQKIAVEGWFVRHSNVQKPGDKVNHVINGVPHARQGQDPLPGEMMGIFPTILIRLFNQRRVLKKRFVALGHLIEHMENIVAENNKLAPYIPPVNEYWDTINKSMLTPAGYTYEQMIELNAAENNSLTFLEEIKFTHSIIDSKQRAIKVFMNTFYGEQGNYLSRIYKLLNAGAITMAGQHAIKSVYNKLLEMGFDPIYGDTDSCYNSPPEKVFEDVDRIWLDSKAKINRTADITNIEEEYKQNVKNAIEGTVVEYHRSYRSHESDYNKKLLTESKFNELIHANFKQASTKLVEFASEKEAPLQKIVYYIIRELYWTMMVQITRRETIKCKDIINKFLKDSNGTTYLSMDYEEVLFPVDFTGKKKYFGFPHLGEENFHPKEKDIFIKGIDIVKQGQSDLAKQIGMEIIYEICSVYNDRDIVDIVKSKIRKIYSTKWDLKHFILSGKYKPSKKNVPILTFVDRMKEQHAKYMEVGTPWYNPEKAALYTPPEPGDSFKYVVVRKTQTYDLRGRKVNLKKGDIMEYVSVYEAAHARGDTSMEIDLNYYMEGAIMGLFARFISYMDEFKAPEFLDEEEADKYSIKLANKYIEKYCNECAGIDNKQLIATGRTYQKLTKFIELQSYKISHKKLGYEIAAVLFRFNIPELVVVETKSTYYNNKIFDECVASAVKNILAYAESLADTDATSVTPYIAALEPLLEADTTFIYDLISIYKVRRIGGDVDPTCLVATIDRLYDNLMEKINTLCRKVIEIVAAFRYRIADVILDARVDSLSDESLKDEDIPIEDDPDNLDEKSNIVEFNLDARIEAACDLIDVTTLTEFYDVVTKYAAVVEHRNIVKLIYRALLERKSSM